MSSKQTPSQTVGPYFAYTLTPEQYGYPYKSLAHPKVVDDLTEGERIRLTGQVLDGDGVPIPDAMIEIWQADDKGQYFDPSNAGGFKGFGRVGTGTNTFNRYWFDTIKPGSIEDGQAPHINMIVFMRGLLSHLYTRVYFSDEISENDKDTILNGIEKKRRETLIAKRQDTPGGVVYLFDIHMQGDRETVFFDV